MVSQSVRFMIAMYCSILIFFVDLLTKHYSSAVIFQINVAGSQSRSTKVPASSSVSARRRASRGSRLVPTDLSAHAPTLTCASRTRRIRPARAIRFVLKTALGRAARIGPSVRMSPKAID